MGISSRTLALVRGRVNQFLTDSCTILKQGDAENDMGVPLNDWIETAIGVSCRVIRAGSQMSSSNVIAGGRENLLDKHRLILPYGTTVAAEYRIEMSDGRAYEIVDVIDDLTDKAYVQVIINRLRDKNG